ncbi:hypothetical protein BaRGS_00013318, partial [Batillaria attramentaria]
GDDEKHGQDSNYSSGQEKDRQASKYSPGQLCPISSPTSNAKAGLLSSCGLRGWLVSRTGLGGGGWKGRPLSVNAREDARENTEQWKQNLGKPCLHTETKLVCPLCSKLFARLTPHLQNMHNLEDYKDVQDYRAQAVKRATRAGQSIVSAKFVEEIVCGGEAPPEQRLDAMLEYLKENAVAGFDDRVKGKPDSDAVSGRDVQSDASFGGWKGDMGKKRSRATIDSETVREGCSVRSPIGSPDTVCGAKLDAVADDICSSDMAATRFHKMVGHLRGMELEEHDNDLEVSSVQHGRKAQFSNRHNIRRRKIEAQKAERAAQEEKKLKARRELILQIENQGGPCKSK